MNFRAIGVGDFAPNSVFADQDGQPVSLVEIPYAGAFTAVAVLRDTGNPNAAAFLGALKAQAAQFEAAGTLLVAVLAMPAAKLASLGNSLQPGFAMLGDANGECAASFGLMESAGAGMIAILDRNSHVIARLTGLPGVAPVAEALAVIAEHLGAETDSAAPSHAPVLLIPRLFEPELCRDLMDFWERGEKRIDEVTQGRGSEVRDNVLSDVKKRADVTVPEGNDPLHQAILMRFNMRVVPRIEKVFQYKTQSYDGARVGCYEAGEDGGGGYFRAHRDSVSHKVDQERRFALSLNLNDGFEGGRLRFNEYGPQTYCPAAGDGVVFSCKLLHEAMPVTKGRRFGLFAFFY
ncbi:MAG: redoxin domain-containing protein [Rhodospirillaceae bacterium]|jgi:peroxiredoxin|nr:redoxin domain-containing protein [Rhodospirillaceae bacterium]